MEEAWYGVIEEVIEEGEERPMERGVGWEEGMKGAREHNWRTYLSPLRQTLGTGSASLRPIVVSPFSRKWNTTPDSRGSSFRLTR